jgi:hypothetical protein
MTKPTERIVVFVTPAQKLAIRASAERLGISVSELMRRALACFDQAGEQVKIAGMVNRLHKRESEPDLIDAALRGAHPAAVPDRAAQPGGNPGDPRTPPHVSEMQDMPSDAADTQRIPQGGVKPLV